MDVVAGGFDGGEYRTIAVGVVATTSIGLEGVGTVYMGGFQCNWMNEYLRWFRC